MPQATYGYNPYSDIYTSPTGEFSTRTDGTPIPVGEMSQTSDAQQSISKTGGDNTNYAGYAAGIASLSNIISGQLATQNFKAQLNASTEAAIQNVGNAVTSFELQQVKNKEQIENINNVLGDKLSERGLNAMKEASLLKTAAAETCTTGGTTTTAIKEAFVNENMDKANIVASARQQTRNLLVGMDIAEVSIQNQIDSVLLGGGVNIGTDPLIAGIAGGLGGITDILSAIPMSERVDAFDITPISIDV